MSEMSLASRLSDEADLCRNDGASDIADLIDEAAAALDAALEALARIAEGDWYRTPVPPYEIDGTNRKVAGEWSKIAREALSRIEGVAK